MVTLTIELDCSNSYATAYISDDIGGSGIEVSGTSPKEIAQNIADYIYDYAHQEMNYVDADALRNNIDKSIEIAKEKGFIFYKNENRSQEMTNEVIDKVLEVLYDETFIKEDMMNDEQYEYACNYIEEKTPNLFC